MASRDSSDELDGVVLSLPRQFTPRLKIGAVLILLLIAVAIAVLISALGSHGSSVSVESIRTSEPEVHVQKSIYVHLLGAVVHPGLYELPENSRAIDVLAAAGGFTGAADRTALNLARFLSDGEQVYVPGVGEVVEGGLAAVGAVGGKVNLNTADAATLETLPRVGPVTAAKIIAWREANGRFTTIDDLKSVSGFGEKTFASLSELITV